MEKGSIAVQFTVLGDNEQLSLLKNVAVFDLFDARRFPVERKPRTDFAAFSEETRSLEANGHEFEIT